MELRYSEKNSGIVAINLGRGIGYSVMQVKTAFEEATAQTIPYEICVRRPGDIATCYADTTKAEQLLGFKAERDINQMCKDLWHFYQINPEGVND